jgi:Glyoxalase-like domain
MSSLLSEIVLESNNPTATAEFWASALGWERRTHQPGDVPWVSASGDPDQHDLKLVFVSARDPERLRNRLYANPHGTDLADEVARLERLGAAALDGQDLATPLVRLRDPGGVVLNLLANRID